MLSTSFKFLKTILAGKKYPVQILRSFFPFWLAFSVLHHGDS